MGEALESIAQALHSMREAMKVMKLQLEKTDETVRGVAEGLTTQKQIIHLIDQRMIHFEQNSDSSGSMYPCSSSVMSFASPSHSWASPVPRQATCADSFPETIPIPTPTRIPDQWIQGSLPSSGYHRREYHDRIAVSSSRTSSGPVPDSWLQESLPLNGSRKRELRDRIAFSTSPSLSRPVTYPRVPESRPKKDSRILEDADRMAILTAPASLHAVPQSSHSPKRSPSPHLSPRPSASHTVSISKHHPDDKFIYSDVYPHVPSNDHPEMVSKSMSYTGLRRPRERSTSPAPRSKTLPRSKSVNNCSQIVPVASTCSADSPAVLGKKLLKAAHYGKARFVRKLLGKGADPNYSSAGKWTPLLRATAKAHANVVKLLLKRGAKVDGKNCYGFTALHIAAYDDYSGRCVSILLEAGAEIDCKNRFGRTALHYAAESGNLTAVLELLAAGASRTIADDDGKTPFDVAHTACFRRILHPKSKGRNLFTFEGKLCAVGAGNHLRPYPISRVHNGLGSPILRYVKDKFHSRFKSVPGYGRTANPVKVMYNPFIQR